RLMDENQLAEIEIETAGAKIRLVKDRSQARGVENPSVAETAVPQASHGPQHLPGAERSFDHCKAIISPMVGTFYRSPSPDAPPLVEAGSMVDGGDELCIIEAMKMRTGMEAEFRGKVARVVAENGQTVEYGESLFLIEPL